MPPITYNKFTTKNPPKHSRMVANFYKMEITNVAYLHSGCIFLLTGEVKSLFLSLVCLMEKQIDDNLNLNVKYLAIFLTKVQMIFR